MVFWTVRRLSNLLLLVLCCPNPKVSAIHFLTKDLALAAILGGILKPRFVPLPIPIPLPFTVNKHVHKPYPVPVHSHSFHAQQIGHHPWAHNVKSQDLRNLEHLGGTHALAELHSASENIDSLVQQLSLSSDVINEGHSHNLHSYNDEFDELGDFSNFHHGENWW